MRHSAMLLPLIVLAGCATTSGRGPDAYEHDGHKFGVVDGTFRARWWSFYERGRSYLDGGYYAEAESDLQTALSLRAEDQRWARTYGLHFIPEYFPNRELGIVRFHAGDLAAAQRLLELSLKQEHTALAAHYLDLVRAAQVSKNGGDHDAPTIAADATALAQGTATEMRATLRAKVSDNTYVSSVTINGEPYLFPASAPSIEITAPFPVAAGANAFTIAATDIAGNTATSTIEITRDFDGPALAFDANTPGLVSGLIADPAGVAELKIDGKSITLEDAGNNTYRFHAAATGDFTATDRLGNVTNGILPAPRTAGILPALGLDTLGSGARVRMASNALLPTFLFAQAPANNTGIRLTNLADGQRYLMDEIVVAIEASNPNGIAAIELDGAPLTGLVPNATSEFLTRRIRLADMGQHAVHAKLTDTKGNISETQVTIERAPTDIERPEERLRVALLGNLWEGAGPTLENEATFVAEELTGALFKRGRVDIVSRDALPRVLEEQELRTVLGSRNLDPGLRQIVPADVLAVGKVRRTGDTMEIVLQAVSSETSNILAYADVAGTVKSLDDLRALARDLALRFEQEFPRASGSVVNAPSADRCFTTLAEADRVRPELPCLVYRFGDPIVHPQTGAVLGRPTQIIARGNIAEVQRQMSRLTLRPDAANPGPVQVNDHVATR